MCRVKRSSGPWVTDKILELIYHRNFLHKKANCSKNKNDYIIYKKVRNCVISEVKKAKKSFYTKAIKTSKSSHDIWKALKTVLPNKIPDNIDPNLNANKFNEYFGSIGSNLTKDLNNQDYKVFPTRSDINFHFHHVNTAFVSKCLLGLRKNSSVDILEFDTTLLKLAALFIAPSIGHICNLSLNQGTVPEDFKLARVTPIYKGKGLKSELGNYRPISVISHISKILEKIVKDQIMDFLTDQNLVTEYQMAYIRGRSTQSAINFLTNHWLNNIDNGLYTTACLIDLSKCFDCVNSDILLQKLTKYGINGIPLNWFRSYLSNRKQVVYFNNKISSVVNLNIGVPQGTVLGPILF